MTLLMIFFFKSNDASGHHPVPAGECLRASSVLKGLTYLTIFGRLNPMWQRMSFRNVLIFSLNNLHRLPLSLLLFICLSPVSISFSLSLTDRHHWHWYKRWLPTNHLSTMTTCPGWETWHPFGGNLDLFCKICDSVIFWDDCGMQFKCGKILQNAEGLAGMY